MSDGGARRADREEVGHAKRAAPSGGGRPPAPWPVHRLGQALARLVVALFVRPRVVGLGNVPAGGPLLVVANHLSALDPPLLVAVLPRRVTFLALEDLFRIAWLAPALRLMRAIPVRRGGRDTASLRTALDVMAAGEAVGIFPEGTRSHRPGLLRANPGVALLALRSEAPVLPVAITGVDRLSSPRRLLAALARGGGGPRVTVVVGRPFRPASGSGPGQHEAIADAIMAEVAALLPPAYRGVYGEPLDATATQEPQSR